MEILKWILTLVCLLQPVLGDNILFYAAFTAKSSCITLIPFVDELVSRGHNVTVLTPWKSLKFDKRATHLTIENTFGALQEESSRKLLAVSAKASVTFADPRAMTEMSFKANSEAIKKVKHFMESK